MRILIVCLILVHMPVSAEDAHDKQALSETQSLLRNKGDREKYIKNDASAKDVDHKLEALVGNGGDKEAVYDIAAKVMEKLTQESAGDPAKMQRLMEEAQKNPKAFYDKMFSESEKSRVRDMAGRIEKQPATVNPSK